MNLSLLGVIATAWLIFGVFVAGRKYSGYNHKRQFMSELGALQSPTQKLSPAINNFPLSILFALFGIYLINSANLIAIGVCVIFHGIGTLIAGIFPMDQNPFTKNPSAACKIHSLAGLVMFVSLLAASALAAFVIECGIIFQVFSAGATLLTLYFAVRLSQEYSRKSNLGLYQRLGYGVQLLWLSCLSVLLFINS